MKTVIIIAIVAVIVIVALLTMRGGGPRVTQIDRTIERKRDEDGDDDA